MIIKKRARTYGEHAKGKKGGGVERNPRRGGSARERSPSQLSREVSTARTGEKKKEASGWKGGSHNYDLRGGQRPF